MIEKTSDVMTNLFMDPTAPKGYARAMRSQADNLGDQISWESGLDTGDETRVRQEDADSADINQLLNKYGAFAQQQRPVVWGAEVDYTMDLQQAIEAVKLAQRAAHTVPQELRDKYPTWRHVLNGVESGQYETDLAELSRRKSEEINKQPDKPADQVTQKPAAQAGGPVT